MLKGDEVRRRREELGMSQLSVAKAAGLSQQNLSRIESGLAKATPKIGRLAGVLGCRIVDLDPDFLGLDGEGHLSPLSEDASTMIAAVASRMALNLGFRPTDAQVIKHLLASSTYRDVGE